MRVTGWIGAGLVASMGLMPPQTARANDLAKGILGALIIGGIAAEAAKARQRDANRQRPQQPSPQYESAKQLQAALNHFGFDAGAVDGRPGRQTKSAVATYQGTLGHPQTGEITEVERQLLLDSMARERLDPAEAMQIAASNPFGRRGLPAAYRQRAYAPPPMPAPTPAPEVARAPTPAPAPQIGLPSFSVPTEPARSVNAHCNQVGIMTTTNGGYATEAVMPDAGQALNEQFCLARTFAIAEGQNWATRVGASQEQITQLCGLLKTRLEPMLANFGSRTPGDLVRTVRADIDGAGKSVAEMQVTGRICLAEGYRTDDPVMANVSAATLAAADLGPYAELLGHHLREGFGTAANPLAARTWLRDAIEMVRAGAAPVIMPGQAAERGAILSKALSAI